MAQKKEKNQAEVFTIDLDQQSDSHEIPGVTQLLNPAKMAEVAKAEARKNFTLEATRTVASTAQIEPPPISGAAPQRLKDLGVLFDFQFTVQNGSFRFHAGIPHAEGFLQAWQQELLADMKFDLKTIFFKEPFHEFRHETFSFLFVAFGVQPQHFIQVVQLPQAKDTIHVLVSPQSQAANQEKVLAILQQTPAEKAEANEKSGVIEIDLAG